MFHLGTIRFLIVISVIGDLETMECLRMASSERGLEFDETVQQIADIALGAANRWQQEGLSYKEASTALLMLTHEVCVEIVAASAVDMRDPAEFARTVEAVIMNGFVEKVVARAEKFKTKK